MAYNIVTLPVSIIFIATGISQLFYAVKLKKQFPKEHNVKNSIFAFFLWITAALSYPFFYSTDNEYIRWFQGMSNFFICIFTPFMIFLILYYQYAKVAKNDPQIKEKRNIDRFVNEFDKKMADIKDMETYDFKTDLHRKALHLFPAGLIVALYIFAVYVWEGMWQQNMVWGISGRDYGVFLILTAGYSGILVFAALDFVRLSYIFKKTNIYHLLPNNVLDLLCKAMKRRELFEFTKPASLILAMVPAFFFPFGVFVSAALIATMGDGAASIIGKKYGKKHFPKKSPKTVIGYISGFVACFLITLICLMLFEFSVLDLSEILIISLFGAMIFLLIDLLSLDVDDNMLNPIFCGFVMGFFYYLFI
jgi:dolichol kinase